MMVQRTAKVDLLLLCPVVWLTCFTSITSTGTAEFTTVLFLFREPVSGTSSIFFSAFIVSCCAYVKIAQKNKSSNCNFSYSHSGRFLKFK